MSFHRGPGRDFLRENKANVRFWETNGRVAAAALARQAPRWRPVVLHYPEKLRALGGSTRPGYGKITEEKGAARCGLVKDERELLKSCRCRCRHKPQAKPKPEPRQLVAKSSNQVCNNSQTDDIKDTKFLNKALSKCKDCGNGEVPSQGSTKSPATKEKAEPEPEQPLSARSSCSMASVATVKSQMSTVSKCSKISNKSSATVCSKKSRVSQASNTSKETLKQDDTQSIQGQPPKSIHSEQCIRGAPNQDGFVLLTSDERQVALKNANARYAQLIDEYNRLPVSAATLRVRNQRIAIERELDEIDYTIHMFDHPNLYMRRN